MNERKKFNAQSEPAAWMFRNEEGELDVTDRWDIAKHLPYDVTELYNAPDALQAELAQAVELLKEWELYAYVPRRVQEFIRRHSDKSKG